MINPLDMWLVLLGSSLFATIYWIYINFVNPNKYGESLYEVNKGLGYYYLLLGIYSFITGLWGSFTWPLPGPYNIILMDPWPVFGVAMILLGLANVYKLNLRGILYGVSALSLPVIFYGLAIWNYGLTREPLISGLMFVFIGLAALLSPLLAFENTKKGAAYLFIILLVIGGLIALYIGYHAVFGHIASFLEQG